MRALALADLALFFLVAGFATGARGELPDGRGVLLPLQDRVGRAEVAELTETLLRQALADRADLIETGDVRDILRSMRVRDASNEPLDRLAVLGERLGAEWFFLATLHEARAGRAPQRQSSEATGGQRFADSGDTPQLVLSARVLLTDSSELWWAGFDGASGRDRERVFGLGEIETLDELMQVSVEALVASAVESRVSRVRPRLRTRSDGYLRPEKKPFPPQRVAVIPMDSVATLDPSASAEVASAALFATLDDFGFKTLLPGFVQSIRQDNGQMQHGAVGSSEWSALAAEGGADWVATGTVETYTRGQGGAPDPWVAFSIRFLDTVDGGIAWSTGIERNGRDTGSAFDRGRIYSTGDLAYEMMRSVFGQLRIKSGTDWKGREK